jgi:hypothetical protein
MTAAPDAAQAVDQATLACRRIDTLTAEVSVTGTLDGQRVRGRLIAGVARPASARLEAAAPFGAPLFIFVAHDAEATLLLPRDDRVLEHGSAADVLDAVAGVPLDPVDLRGVLTGCAIAPQPAAAEQAGPDWRIVPDRAGRAYLHREGASGSWRLTASIHAASGNGDGWRAEYRNFQDGLPRDVRLASTVPKRFDLRVTLSQLETNVALGPGAFRVEIPRGARAITISELRESGPLSSRGASGR